MTKSGQFLEGMMRVFVSPPSVFLHPLLHGSIKQGNKCGLFYGLTLDRRVHVIIQSILGRDYIGIISLALSMVEGVIGHLCVRWHDCRYGEARQMEV